METTVKNVFLSFGVSHSYDTFMTLFPHVSSRFTMYFGSFLDPRLEFWVGKKIAKMSSTIDEKIGIVKHDCTKVGSEEVRVECQNYPWLVPEGGKGRGKLPPRA